MSDKFLERFEKAVQRKSQWETTIEEVMNLVSPRRETFDFQTKGSPRRGGGEIFDSTAVKGLNKFASNLQSSLVPPFEKWVELTPGEELTRDNDKNQVLELKTQLKAITDTMFAHIKNSNFDVQIAESFLDLGIGTGALLVQKGRGKQKLHFSCVPMSELFLEKGVDGSVGAVYRRHKVCARLIKETWPDAKLYPELEQLIKEKPDHEVEVVEGTVPEKITVKKLVDGKVVEQKVEGYVYKVVVKGDKKTIVNRETESTPWIVFRYNVTPGEVYGRGPAMSVFNDIKIINKTKELILKNASLAVAGAYTVADDGVINVNNIRIRPGALIPVASNPGGVQGPTIAPLPRSGDFNVGQLILEDLRNSINEEMLVDPLGPVDAPVKTATEVALRQQELAKRTGSTFGRLQFELITPLINRILFLLEEQGVIDLSGFRVDGGIIAIEHKSPLATAKASREFLAMQQLADVLNATFGPQVTNMIINSMRFGQKASDHLGSDPEILNTQEEIDQIKQELAAAAQAAAQEGEKIG